MANQKRIAAVAANEGARAERAAGNLTAAAAKSTHAWLEAQTDLLHEVDGASRALVQRRRETIRAAQRSIEEMQSCRDPMEMLRVQQQFIADSLQRIASDMGELGMLAVNLSQHALSGMWQSGRAAGEEVRQGEEFAMSAAGSKPRGRPARDGKNQRKRGS